MTRFAVVYLSALIWCFFGVAVLSNSQMAGIEVITSERHRIKRTDEHGKPVHITVLVWNATIANVLLLALGSSSPGIVLNLVDTAQALGRTGSQGTLGPSSVVGAVNI
jgi:Sodium/calcium exchanger protein